jgi:hypothetical protein
VISLNPLGLPAGSTRPNTFGFVGHYKFQKEHPELIADAGDNTIMPVAPEHGLEIQNNALAVCYDILGEFLPEDCSPKLGRVEMFYLIRCAVHAAAEQIKGADYSEADVEEYMQDDQVIAMARELVEPVFAKHYKTMFEGFEGFTHAAKMLVDRVDETKKLGYVPIVTDPNIIDLDVPVGDEEEDIPYDPDDSELDSVIPKKRILVDAKEYADRRLPLAVNFVIKKMERIYSIRLEQAEVLQQIGSTIENDPHFVHPIEVQIRHENVISALKDLKYGLQHTYTRADQEKQLHAYQDSMIEDVIYDGLPIGSYSDLRLTLDMIQERLTNGLYRSDDHPWIDLFAKLSEKGEMCDQVYDDLCNVYHAKQLMNGIPKTLEDGKPNPKWHYTPYNEAMEAFFDGEVPDRQLTIAEREQIDEMTQEMTKDLLAPYSQGLPEDRPEVMFWFVARATEFFANQEVPFAQRVKERTPPRITRGDLTVIECLPEEPDPERLTAVEARRKAMHIVREEDPTLLSEAMVKKSKGKKRKPKEADETSRYNSEEVRAKVDALLSEIFADPACKDAATNIDHLLAAKTKLEAKLRNTSVAPIGDDNPSIDQGR